MEVFLDLLKKISSFDIIYFIITFFSVLKCYKKGFVLSILSMAKWLLAYIITLLIFPKVKPYLKDIIDNEYVLDLILGLGIFIIVIFIILLINKSVKKVVSYSGIGTIDKVFGFFFGIIKSYVIIVCIYAASNIIYNHEKWPLNLDDSFTFTWVEKR